MRKRYLVTVSLPVVVLALMALAQDSGVTDLRSWLNGQQQRSADTDATVERQAVRDRIAAVRKNRGRVTALNANGHWRSEQVANLSARRLREQQWFVQLERNAEDGTIAGRLTVVGSGSLSGGIIAGRISDEQVSGTVRNEEGAQLATFNGVVSPQGMSGSYTTLDGDVGNWAIDSSGDRAVDGLEEPPHPAAANALIEDAPAIAADAPWDASASE